MNTKKIFGGFVFALIAIMSFVAAPSASAYVNESINGTFYKDNEHITISYSKSYGRASVNYQVWECDEPVIHFIMSGKKSGSYLVVSGSGVRNGVRKNMKVKITQVDYDTIKVIVGSGKAYYFYRGQDW